MIETLHECDDCGDDIKILCYCKKCFEKSAEFAYEDGKADGKKEAEANK